jgi:hypothetical protein
MKHDLETLLIYLSSYWRGFTRNLLNSLEKVGIGLRSKYGFFGVTLLYVAGIISLNAGRPMPKWALVFGGTCSVVYLVYNLWLARHRDREIESNLRHIYDGSLTRPRPTPRPRPGGLRDQLELREYLERTSEEERERVFQSIMTEVEAGNTDLLGVTPKTLRKELTKEEVPRVEPTTRFTRILEDDVL